MRPLKNLCEITVIGGGMAGLAAARQAARLGRLVTLFEGSGLYGGLVATVGDVEGLPFPGTFSGQDLAMHLLDECKKAQVRVIETNVASLATGERLTLTEESGAVHHPDAIVVATGAALRRLGVPGEEEYFGRGVSRCTTCDGGFFRGQTVVVTGGGDAAVHEALELAKLVREVIMVCRSPVRAKRSAVDRLAAKDNVRFVWDSEIIEILGDESGVTGVTVRDVRTHAAARLDCVGVFPFVGVEPATKLLPAAPDPRIFIAGSARQGYGGNLVEAMAEGVSAAERAAKMLAEGEREA